VSSGNGPVRVHEKARPGSCKADTDIRWRHGVEGLQEPQPRQTRDNVRGDDRYVYEPTSQGMDGWMDR